MPWYQIYGHEGDKNMYVRARSPQQATRYAESEVLDSMKLSATRVADSEVTGDEADHVDLISQRFSRGRRPRGKFRMTNRIPNPDDIAARWPLDGPYSPEATAAALHAVGELLRYVNHATHRADSAPTGADVHDQVMLLAGALGSVSKALRQLVARAMAVAAEPDAATHLTEVADAIANVMRGMLGQAAVQLDQLRETIAVLSDSEAVRALADTEPVVRRREAVRALVAERVAREQA